MSHYTSKKINGVALFFVVCGIIASVVGGFVLIISSDESALLGIFVIFGGLLSTWISFLFFELVQASIVKAEKLTLIEKHIYDYLSSNVAQAPSVAPKAPATSAPATPSASTAPQSDHLEYFRAQGLITEEEYQQALRLKQQ